MNANIGLGGQRILDLTDEKGAYATRILADLGADVIKVEPPQGDKTRNWPPFFHDDPGPENSLYFLFYNLNKRSITLDLSLPDGKDIFLKLIKKADALVESFPVGHLEHLGLGYNKLKEINPTLVIASITHFGQTGPWNKYESSDLVDMSLGGIVQLTGEPSGYAPLRFGLDQSVCF